jgi:hypothetical protein
MTDANTLKSNGANEGPVPSNGGKGKGPKGKNLAGSDEGPDKAMLQKARKAYDNAKQRCGKPGNYETVKFLLPSFKDFVVTIGLPKPGQSLDRMDPNGHYEISNLRWTNNAVQAANKKHSTGGSKLPLEVMVAQARSTASSVVDRQAVSEVWMAYIAFYARAYSLVPGDIKALEAKSGITASFENSFYPDELPDTRLPPGIFHLPSLTEPGRLVRIRGGPFLHEYIRGASDWDVGEAIQKRAKRGLIAPFNKEITALNFLPLELQEHIADHRSSNLHGACWVGRPTADALLSGWFEGKMLASACRLMDLDQHSAIYPARIALERWSWFNDPKDNYPHTIVDDCEHLFIPDFQVDAGIGFRSAPSELFKLAELVRHRVAAKKKTFIGIQNPNILPADVRNFLFANLSVREIDPTAQVPHPNRQAIRTATMTARAELGLPDIPRLRITRSPEDMLEEEPDMSECPYRYEG